MEDAWLVYHAEDLLIEYKINASPNVLGRARLEVMGGEGHVESRSLGAVWEHRNIVGVVTS